MRYAFFDKLHFKGHVACLDTHHPDLFPELADINTEVCEQVNFWLSKYKYILKHMNFYRYNFFLYKNTNVNHCKIDFFYTLFLMNIMS